MGEESSRTVPTEPSTPSLSSLAHGSTGERPRGENCFSKAKI